MKMTGLALAGALALAACGGREGAATGAQTEGGNEGGPDAGPCADGVTLRMVGLDPGMVTSLALFGVGASAAFETGGSIAVTAAYALPSVDADPRTFAVLHLPKLETRWGHALVAVSYSWGSAQVGEVLGSLDACTAPLLLNVDPGLVKPDTCEVFVRLDVGRSIALGPAGLSFLPQFRIAYY